MRQKKSLYHYQNKERKMAIDNKTKTAIAVGAGTAVTLAVGGGIWLNHTIQERRRKEEERQRQAQEALQEMIMTGIKIAEKLIPIIIKTIK